MAGGATAARAATGTLLGTARERAPLGAAPAGGRPLGDAALAAGRNFVAPLAGVIATAGVWAPLGPAASGAWPWRRRRRQVARASSP